VKAVSEGVRSFTALAVVSDVVHPISPCGMCRQVLHEFCPPTLSVLLVPADWAARVEAGDAQGGVKETTLADLFPMSYDERLDLPEWTETLRDSHPAEKDSA